MPSDTRSDSPADDVAISVHDFNTQPENIPLPLDSPRQTPPGLAETSAHSDTLQSELDETKAALEALRNEHESTKDLLRLRSDELRGARAFVTTTDKISLSDVQRAVQRLNAEVFQMAASVAEKWEYRTTYGVKDPEREELETTAAKVLKGVIGGRLVGLLRTVRHDKSPYCIQLALQCRLAAFIKELSDRWSVGERGDKEEYMRMVYERLKESEAPAVSRMWRAYASRFSRKPEDNTSHARSAIAEHLVGVLLVAGVKGDEVDIKTALLESFSTSIENLLRQIAALQEILHESIVSCELHLTVARPDDNFYESQMGDIGSTQACAGQRIICTVDVGLIRAEEVNGVVHATTLLKPKVCTDAMVHDLMQVGAKDGRPPKRTYTSRPHRHRGRGRRGARRSD